MSGSTIEEKNADRRDFIKTAAVAGVGLPQRVRFEVFKSDGGMGLVLARWDDDGVAWVHVAAHWSSGYLPGGKWDQQQDVPLHEGAFDALPPPADFQDGNTPIDLRISPEAEEELIARERCKRHGEVRHGD